MATEGAGLELAKWSHQWFAAAYLQAQRAVGAWNSDDLAGLGDAETELLMFVDALNNARRGRLRSSGCSRHLCRPSTLRCPASRSSGTNLNITTSTSEALAGSSNRLGWRTGINGGRQRWMGASDGAPTSHLSIKCDSASSRGHEIRRTLG